jgi:hypothetical protein
MRNLLALVGAAILTFAGAGWYLGWYRLQPTLSTTPGHQTLNIDINGQKIKDDVGKGEQQVEGAAKRLLDGSTAKDSTSLAPKVSAQ